MSVPQLIGTNQIIIASTSNQLTEAIHPQHASIPNAAAIQRPPQQEMTAARLACDRVLRVHVQRAVNPVNVDIYMAQNEMAKKAGMKKEDMKINYPPLQMNSPIPGDSLFNAYGSPPNTQLTYINDLNPAIHSSFLKSEKYKNKNDFSYKNSIEYKTLIQRYSSGVRLPELCSLAKILSSILLGVLEPTRDEKRSFQLLINWYHKYWDLIVPVLPFLQLRDENNQIIDGRRELIDRCLQSK